MTSREKVLMVVVLIGLAMMAWKMKTQDDRIDYLTKRLAGLDDEIHTVSVVKRFL